jgi:hypothetical protein
VAKLSSDGSALLHSTYLGGAGTDIASDIVIDGARNACVIGNSTSTDFPTTNAFQGSFASSSSVRDAVVARLNAAGSALVYSTYLEGTSAEYAYDIALDVQGNAYVTGRTASAGFPTISAYPGSRVAGYDIFLGKLTPTGSALSYSTYLGGTGTDSALCIFVDEGGDAFLGGYTSSTDFPTVDPYQLSPSGLTEAFVTRLDATGSRLIYSTCLGGGGAEAVQDIERDEHGILHLVGYTDSSDFPTAYPYDASSTNTDAFVTRLNATGSALLYSTYLGGGLQDYGEELALDSLGRTYITGYTNSPNYPVVNAFQSTLGGSDDAFITKISNPVMDFFIAAALRGPAPGSYVSSTAR